ncbi:MAG: hypothetical protein NTW55_08335 [Planctomycetota bacterium]|nr:hypothetical protein [Planctomycetota bacterium]
MRLQDVVDDMVKRKSVFAAVIIMMLLTNYILGSDSTLVNGSFEADGVIADLSGEDTPTGWTDVNMPVDVNGMDLFGGYVYNDWVTNGKLNLTVYSVLNRTFNINDRASVAQYVYLTDVNAIWFDLELVTDSVSRAWDPNVCTAVLEIDNVPVWESPSDKADVRGQYRNQMYSVNPMYNDNILHKIALVLRINVVRKLVFIHYAEWDNIRLSLFTQACGGYGYPTGDFNHDCVVDFLDYAVLAEEWLNETDPCNPNHICDLYHSDYGVINFRDFAVYAKNWDCNTTELGMMAEVWLQEVDANDQSNLYHGDDVEPIGIIDWADLAVFSENWLKHSP